MCPNLIAYIHAYHVRLLHASADAVCNDQFLVTATNTESGADVRIFSPSGKSYVQKYIQLHLSPECGENYFRCGEPFIVDYTVPSTEQESQHFEHVVILPLAKAIGLLKMKLNSNHVLYVSGDYTIDLSEHNCSPTAIYHISNAYYVVCLNTENNFLTLLELRLNVTILEDSYIRDERDQFPPLNALSNVTNFVYVYLFEHFIFFAAGYNMVAFKPLSYTFQSWEVELEKLNCYVMSLAYIGDGEMLAFCLNKQAVYIDLNRETTFFSINYTTGGRPFVCPNPDIFLSVHTAAKYVEYGLRSSNEVKNFEIPMLQFDNGICLRARNKTLFAYTDRDMGVHLLEVPEGILTTLSTTSCINYPCQRLVLLGDRYLVIREKRGASWFITVFDSAKENFTAVIEVPHTQADLMGVVETVVPCSEPPSNGTNQQQEATISDSKSNSNTSIVIIIVVCCAAFIAVVTCITTVIAVYCVYCKRKR